ncbi:putative Zn-binding protein involved in type VI secretion [Paraburkholderia sp. BL6669N2]|uniref:PAAR domain-containing protein n=1 Tax=Paraburkholderia sp. BL6669N2 TaxID=1938807 RepID=UPI000E226891|nr:PAAR domain-containing protein [Paraburkholderia sp. BL6669N2]REG61371.1 putative Zn-binding protein involved in type VI secretion [Paraburkholderia sp. BL6669N2]
MARQVIVVGDTTTRGGKVITGSQVDVVDGKAIARKGDLVACPEHGVNPIVEGDESLMVDDKPVALEGHHAACGCALVSACHTLSVP